ncbi:MAG: bacillithiol biosynthesis cysteine-adding enzyme BshC [Chitinophagaceae bacterium]|nr:bacillithiol biosynthesis cysteine-adding enzyme BshC [Chitinophagaceae bacterium]
MDCTFTQLPYGDTGFFSQVATAYATSDSKLQPFYKHPVSIEGIAAAINSRKQFKTDRQLIVGELQKQYGSVQVHEKVNQNINLLLNDNSFVICTAHQPAIFTGSLFFVYKILHAVKLAEHLSTHFPGNNFVPVFYMGCEDADLDELGNITLDGEKINWDTNQSGAIGRMNTKGLDKIINRIEGELSVQPYGKKLVQLLRECYPEKTDIQTATFKLLNALFGEYGLVVLIPDNANLKRKMIPVFEDELFNQQSSEIVRRSIARLSEDFKVQAQPRDINLFYLKDNIRERIERSGDTWSIVNTNITFSADEIRKELNDHPERFSPNVILRGLFQETILPGVAFIGGGGEIAYWLELKGVFEKYNVPYPVLVLRNSFLVLEKKWKESLDKLRIPVTGIFKDELVLLNDLVKRESVNQLSLTGEITHVNSYYDKMKSVAEQIDETLTTHVAALQTRAIKPLQELEKKLLRAERRKFEVQQRQLSALKKALFPNNGLQERVENFMPFYAKWGDDFFKMIYRYSLTLEQEFRILTC